MLKNIHLKEKRKNMYAYVKKKTTREEFQNNMIKLLKQSK